MPITPFHFGPGALLKAAAPTRLSWTTFALANCLIDLEPIALYLATGDPAHPWLHTLPGALLVAAIAAMLGRPVCEWGLRWWNRQLNPAQARWLGSGISINRAQAWTGALVGTLSHLAMDVPMHPDVRPLWPFIADNPWHGVISLDILHWSALATVLPALLILVLRRRPVRYQ